MYPSPFAPDHAADLYDASQDYDAPAEGLPSALTAADVAAIEAEREAEAERVQRLYDAYAAAHGWDEADPFGNPLHLAA